MGTDGHARGWLRRLWSRIREANRARLRRRAERGARARPDELLAALAANDTAILEALAFLVAAAREQRAALAEIRERLDALERAVGAGGEPGAPDAEAPRLGDVSGRPRSAG